MGRVGFAVGIAPVKQRHGVAAAEQGFAFAQGHESALAQDRAAGGERPGFGEIVGAEQERRLPGEPGQDFANFLGLERV